MTSGTVTAEATSLFPRFLDLEYPEIARGEGLWLETSRGRRAGRAPRLLLQPPLHERTAGAAGRPPAAARRARDGARPLGERRLRGERDRAPARPPVPRRTRRDGAVARDIACSVVPRLDDGDPRPLGPAAPPRAVHAVPRRAPAHPALDRADGPDRRGRAGGARSAPGRPRRRGRRVLLRTGER